MVQQLGRHQDDIPVFEDEAEGSVSSGCGSETRFTNNVPSEGGALIHIVEGGLGLGVTQQGLGRHQDERLAERQSDLSPQDVEVRGGRRTVGHNPVTVVQLTHCKKK